MDHPLVAPESLVRPWRTAAYVAGAIAAVELLLLLTIGGGKLVGFVSEQRERRSRAARARPGCNADPEAERAAVGPGARERPRSRTVVLVLNGNGRTGAAAAAASRVQARGYRIGAVTNAPQQVPRSIVMFRPGFAGEGRRLGRDLGVKLVTPLDGMRPRALGRAHAVFILGP